MMEKPKFRKIIHVDMDAFFAAVEIRDNPEYRGKPLIVGGPPNSRGVVSTCSYEARKYGIHSAMPSATAYRLCPHAIFVNGRFEAYREASEQIRKIFHEYSDLVEPLSIDEAFIDVTFNKKNIPSATLIAKDIKKKIFETTKLTASAGVSYNKFLAKIASDMDKPNGLVVIPPEKAIEVLENLPIGKFYGVGKVGEKKMLSLGIKNGSDLKRRSLKELIKHFGKVGSFYYHVVRGIDNREVKANRIRKSIGTERTFPTDIDDLQEMTKYLKKFALKIGNILKEKRVKARTLTLKVKYANFDISSKSKTFSESIDDNNLFFYFARKLLLETLGGKCKIRLLGISVSNLEWENENLVKQIKFPFFDSIPAFFEE